MRIYKNAENNCYTGYYHVSPWARVSLPSILYRATTCDPTKDDWTITDGGGTILNLRHPYEYDQTADPSPLFNSSNGNNYLFYTAADNSTGGTGFHAMATPLFPTLYQYDGNEWKIAQSGYDADNALNGTNLGYSYNINAVLTPPSTYTGETVGAWTVSAPTTTGGSTLVSDGAVNDRASWLLPSLPPGNYTATITYDTCSSCGIITVNMDRGVNALTGGTIDTYSASTAYAATSSVTFTTFGVPWRRFIQLNMNTKNASSSNYVGNIRGITITGTSF